jgi:hypothetical protein
MNRRIAMTNIECLLAERIRKLAERRKRDRVPPACPWAREDYMQRMRQGAPSKPVALDPPLEGERSADTGSGLIKTRRIADRSG